MSQSATAPRVIAGDVRPAATTRRYGRGALRAVLMLGGIAVVIVGSVMFWLSGGRYVSIDDSYVRAGKLAVSTDISGIVAQVDVKDGQQVHRGDELFRLDDKPFRIALDGANANLAQVRLLLEAMKRDYQRMLTDVEVRSAQVQDDQANFDRMANLVRGGGVTRADYDTARFRLASDKAAVESLKVQAQVQLAKLGGDANVDVTTMPQYLQAKSQVDEAQRQLDHTVVHAPFDAIATNVDSVQPGMYLAASTAAFGLVSTENVWIEGNPKETELTWVKPGDPATVTIDTYPGREWTGHVAIISPNSGSEFSVLPAQNASGNWVKVVQRIPLRVVVDRHPGDPDLRAGMSAVVSVDTGHKRTPADLVP